MGVKGGSSFLFKICCKSIHDLFLAMKEVKNIQQPVLYINCNWAAYYLGRGNGLYVKKPLI